MKKISVLMMSVMAAVLFAASCNQSGGKGISTDVNLKTAVDSASYAIGVNFGSGLKTNLATLPGEKANVEAVIAGFAAAIQDESLKIDQQTAMTYLNQYVTGLQSREAEETKAEGEAFLNANKTKDGVITTESGLQYKVLKEGSSKIKPTINDQVKVHYTGKLLDGTVFDSSVERGEPVTFALTQVVRGWTEALQIMPEGSKYQVWIPSDLGYGEGGAGQMIKPNSTLEFEIELLEVVRNGNQ
ncbi:MAG: FKBP-type peptidyl-prolyl cis-trans isomerase [Tannerella sp.]|nr:FKBP-type peptidyl-prolyl cis-trans isomerase [Tannerella sp.]